MNDVETVAIARLWRFSACEHSEFDDRGEAFGVAPAGERVPLVPAHDPVEL